MENYSFVNTFFCDECFVLVVASYPTVRFIFANHSAVENNAHKQVESFSTPGMITANLAAFCFVLL
jgi:hypothetical protein